MRILQWNSELCQHSNVLLFVSLGYFSITPTSGVRFNSALGSLGCPLLRWFFPSSLPPVLISFLLSGLIAFPKSELLPHLLPNLLRLPSSCDWFLSWFCCYYRRMTFWKDSTIKTYTRDIFLSWSLDLKWLSITLMFLFTPSTQRIAVKPLILWNTLIKIWISELYWDQRPEDDTEPGVIHVCRGMKRRDYIPFKKFCFFGGT